MKKIILIILLLVGVTVVQAQRGPRNPQLNELIGLKDSVQLQERLNSLYKSDKESDLLLLANYYNMKRNPAKSSEINQLILTRFPKGRTAFNKACDDIYNETDGPTNVKNYDAFLERFGNEPQFKGDQFFQYAKTYVAFSFAHKEPEKVKLWIDKITDTIYRTQAYSYGARQLASARHYSQAEQLIKLAMSETKQRGLKNSRDSAAYLDYARACADILLAQKKYSEGYIYGKMAYDECKGLNSKIDKAWFPKIKATYCDLLVGTERYTEAYPMMEECIRDGSSSPIVKERFEKAYQIVNGSTKGYNEHYASLTSTLLSSIKKKVAAQIINEPAFNFKLTDVKGNIVTLESLKGKVVILDFWATWCGPCKASFPKMQMAVNKYENDPEVIFLFVHTWETETVPAKAIANASKYLTSNNYTFNLLMDLKPKGAPNRSNEAARGFKLIGIPTKLILDKDGNIRFRVVGGGSEGDDEFLAEMVEMIELARKG